MSYAGTVDDVDDESEDDVEDGASVQNKKAPEKTSFFAYLPALIVAMLKDLLDFTGIGSLPGIGFVVTLCFTFLIFMLLLLFTGKNKSTLRKMETMAQRAGILIGGGLFEGLFFGANLLPVETGMVIAIYLVDKAGDMIEETVSKVTGEET